MIASTLYLALPTLLAFLGPSGVQAEVAGSQTITPHDYAGMGEAALSTNPPACGMPYSSLDIARITAVENLNAATDCGACVEVTNTNDPTKKAYVLAVDRGGRGLDVSSTTFEQLFATRLDPSPASWKTVDASFCLDIVKGPLPQQYPGLAGVQSQLASRQVDTEAKSNDSESIGSTLRNIPDRFAAMTGLSNKTTNEPNSTNGTNGTTSSQSAVKAQASDGATSLASMGTIAFTGILSMSIFFANL